MVALLSVIGWRAAVAQLAAGEAANARTGSNGTAASRHSRGTSAHVAAIVRGKRLFGANCAFCHGSNAQGGEVGPNLLTSPVVRSDRNGEAIAIVVQNGRVAKGMPKFDLSTAQIADIAAFLRSLGVAAGPQAQRQASIPEGAPAAGKRFFDGQGHCSRCHSAAGDLAGIGRTLTWMKLQDLIVTGGSTGMLGTRLPGARPRTVRVILPSGAVTDGRLESIDDFDVTLIDARGKRHTITRHGAVPKVEVDDPYEAHYELLKANREEAVHDLTAYLEGLK